MVEHGQSCPCCRDLSAALVALEQVSAILGAFVSGPSADLFDKHYADFRRAQIRVRVALELYREHLPAQAKALTSACAA
jgi:hypothetical protein